MDITKSAGIAHALYRSHGDNAELEAARKENLFKAKGDKAEALRWRAIRQSIRRMRGANQS